MAVWGDDDGADHRLDALAAALAADAEIADREARWWARRAAEESATLAGLLVDAAEAGHEVLVRTAGGGAHRGRVVAVGVDAVAIDVRAGRAVIPLDAITTVRGSDRPETRTGERAGHGARFVALLADLVADRPEVSVGVRAEVEPVIGTLIAAGADLVTIRTPAGAVHVTIGAISEVVVRG